VSLSDVRKALRDQWGMTLVSQIMTPVDKLAIVTPQEDATEALSELGSHDIHQLPVVQDGRLVGVLRHRDIVRWLRLHSDRLAS
jgi:CBS domain-containing protein